MVPDISDKNFGEAGSARKEIGDETHMPRKVDQMQNGENQTVHNGLYAWEDPQKFVK